MALYATENGWNGKTLGSFRAYDIGMGSPLFIRTFQGSRKLIGIYWLPTQRIHTQFHLSAAVWLLTILWCTVRSLCLYTISSDESKLQDGHTSPRIVLYSHRLKRSDQLTCKSKYSMVRCTDSKRSDMSHLCLANQPAQTYFTTPSNSLHRWPWIIPTTKGIPPLRACRRSQRQERQSSEDLP